MQMNLCKRLWKELLTAVWKAKHYCNFDVFLFLSRKLSRLEQNHGFRAEGNLHGVNAWVCFLVSCAWMCVFKMFRHRAWQMSWILVPPLSDQFLKCISVKASFCSRLDDRWRSRWSCLWEEKESVCLIWPLQSDRCRMNQVIGGGSFFMFKLSFSSSFYS